MNNNIKHKNKLNMFIKTDPLEKKYLYLPKISRYKIKAPQSIYQRIQNIVNLL